MTEFTFDHPESFPAGTEIGVYKAEQVPNTLAAPIGAAVQTKTYEGAALTFTGLGTQNYFAGALVGGRWRYVRLAAGVLGGSLKPPARYPGHPTH